MENKELEILKAEIERFKVESLKTHVVKVWAESYTNSDPFGYVIWEKENNKVWWMKTQAHQLWEMWQAAKATPEGFVLVPKVLPSEINDQVWDDYLTPQCVVNEDGFSFISCEDFDLDALYQTLLKAQEQSHDSQNT